MAQQVKALVVNKAVEMGFISEISMVERTNSNKLTLHACMHARTHDPNTCTCMISLAKVETPGSIWISKKTPGYL